MKKKFLYFFILTILVGILCMSINIFLENTKIYADENEGEEIDEPQDPQEPEEQKYNITLYFQAIDSSEKELIETNEYTINSLREKISQVKLEKYPDEYYTYDLKKDGNGGVSNDFSQLDPQISEITIIFKYTEYRIEYYLDSGVLDKSINKIQSYTYNSENIVIDYFPTKKGYDFDGWSITPYANIYESVSIPKHSYGNKIVTAHWRDAKYTLEIDGKNLGEFNYNDLLPDVEQKYGYTFTLYSYKNAQETGGLFSSNDIKTIVDRFEDISGSCNIALEAIYQPNSHKIKTYKEDGTLLKEYPVTFDKLYTILADEKKGYDFDGWYLGDVKFKSSGIYNIDQDISLYPKFTPMSFRMFIEYEDGKDEFSVQYEKSVNLNTNFVKSINGTIFGFYYMDNNKKKIIADNYGIINKYDKLGPITVFPIVINYESENLKELYLNADDLCLLTYYKNAEDKNSIDFKYSIYVDDKKVDFDSKINTIGNHVIKIKNNSLNDEVVFSKDILIKEEIGFLNGATYINAIQINRNPGATYYLDGKKIEKDSQFRIEKNGTHKIKIEGLNGYSNEYEVTFVNENIPKFWILFGISMGLLLIGIIMLIFGRRHLVKYEPTST